MEEPNNDVNAQNGPVVTTCGTEDDDTVLSVIDNVEVPPLSRPPIGGFDVILVTMNGKQDKLETNTSD